MQQAPKTPAKKQTACFTLDCTLPCQDRIISASSLRPQYIGARRIMLRLIDDIQVEYLRERIKVDGKANNLGTKVSVDIADRGKILVRVELPFAKRYIKYLAKKYLKKHRVRDFLRVIATNKNTYMLRYFNPVALKAYAQ